MYDLRSLLSPETNIEIQPRHTCQYMQMNSLVFFFELAYVLTNLFAHHGSSWVDLPTSVGFSGLFYAMWCYWGPVISFKIAAIHP